jgi:hypothetical protein
MVTFTSRGASSHAARSYLIDLSHFAGQAHPMECAVGGGYYGGKNLLVTGATGLVGKVLLDAILRNLADVNRVFIMIRPRTDAAGRRMESEEVLHKEIISSSAFDFLRQRHGAGFVDFIRSKVRTPYLGEVKVTPLSGFSDPTNL